MPLSTNSSRRSVATSSPDDCSNQPWTASRTVSSSASTRGSSAISGRDSSPRRPCSPNWARTSSSVGMTFLSAEPASSLTAERGAYEGAGPRPRQSPRGWPSSYIAVLTGGWPRYQPLWSGGGGFSALGGGGGVESV